MNIFSDSSAEVVCDSITVFVRIIFIILRSEQRLLVLQHSVNPVFRPRTVSKRKLRMADELEDNTSPYQCYCFFNIYYKFQYTTVYVTLRSPTKLYCLVQARFRSQTGIFCRLHRSRLKTKDGDSPVLGDHKTVAERKRYWYTWRSK